MIKDDKTNMDDLTEKEILFRIYQNTFATKYYTKFIYQYISWITWISIILALFIIYGAVMTSFS